MRAITLSLLLAVAVAGCATQRELALASAGKIGCAPEEIEISDKALGISSVAWVATCKGRKYACSQTEMEDDSFLNCKEVQ